MDFTSEWATEGSRSLKMWTIPPKEAETTYISSVTCSNVTDPNFPIIENTFSNTTMSVNYNVTFPATNMRLRFDAKKCDDLVQQHGALAIFNLSWTGIFPVEIIACPEFCYGSSCENEPKGEFYYDLVDENSSSLFDTTQYVDMDVLQQSGRKATIEYDLSNSGIEVGRNYTLSFAVYNRNYYDTNGNCVMLDNVRYDVLTQPFLSIMGDSCESQCVGDDWYQATLMNSGGCLVKRVRYSDICISSEFSDEIANNTDYCIDSGTLRHYNSFIGDYEEVTCENGCSSGHCRSADEVTEQEEAEEEQESLLSPIIPLAAGTDFWGFAFIFSLFGIAMFLTFAIMIIAARVSKAGEIGIAAGTGAVLMFWYAGLFPAIVGILMTVALGLMLAKLLADRFLSNKGGG